MNNQDFTTTILVANSPKEVFDAVTNVRGWWSEEIEGGTARQDDEFVYHYKDVHYCKARLTEVIAGKKVVWTILDNRFKFTNDKTEWIGTRVIFDISEKDGQTQMQFTHHGLVPAYECYEVCREAWTNYIQNSLRQLIETGRGTPNPKEGIGYNAELAEKFNL